MISFLSDNSVFRAKRMEEQSLSSTVPAYPGIWLLSETEIVSGTHAEKGPRFDSVAQGVDWDLELGLRKNSGTILRNKRSHLPQISRGVGGVSEIFVFFDSLLWLLF
mmetsp:Transcript_18016/g.39096  ORF Transcript_18016/g.39096 Transcript_18016/m.39096 type:complete len:107 (-) Transcript_18016:510-830(-)